MTGRAVAYVRVSTPDQVKNYSLDSQEDACRRYCEQQGLMLERVFREEGASAKTAARPVLQQMLDHCATHAKVLDYVIIYRVDRLARRSVDYHSIRVALSSLGVKLRAVEESFDDSASGQLVESLMAAIAKFDNDVRADRTIRGMREALTRGRWMWRPPLGYVKPARVDSPSLEPDPEVAPLIRHAFRPVRFLPETNTWRAAPHPAVG